MLDEMPLYEVDLFLEYIHLVDKAASERMRMMCWMTAQVNSRKKLKPEDIIKFEWERDKPTEQISTDRLDELQKQAQQIRAKLNF